jgi:hypothetical protein
VLAQDRLKRPHITNGKLLKQLPVRRLSALGRLTECQRIPGRAHRCHHMTLDACGLEGKELTMLVWSARRKNCGLLCGQT